jgi:hypothetical protein
MTVNGHYLSTEGDFLERRRRGLSRFMNSIVRHPVLREDDVVVAFITVPTVHPPFSILTPGTIYLAKICLNPACRGIRKS